MLHSISQNTTEPVQGFKSGLAVVYIYPVEPNLCDETAVTDSILGEYMVDEKTSVYWHTASLIRVLWQAQ